MALKNRLPSMPSSLIKVALKDLETVEKDKTFEVDMSEWLTIKPPKSIGAAGICVVCVAGAVMAQTLRRQVDDLLRNSNDDFYPYALGESVTDHDKDALHSLGYLRDGDVASFLIDILGHETVDKIPSDSLRSLRSPGYVKYEVSPKDYKAWLRKVIVALEALKL